MLNPFYTKIVDLISEMDDKKVKKFKNNDY
jgi:hypothetical protein